MSFAYMAMRSARSFQAAPNFERPIALKNVHYGRLFGYSALLTLAVASYTHAPTRASIDARLDSSNVKVYPSDVL